MATLLVCSRNELLGMIFDGGRSPIDLIYEGSIEIKVDSHIADKERIAVVIKRWAPDIPIKGDSGSDMGRVELTLIHPTLCISYSCVLRFAKQPTPDELEVLDRACIPLAWHVKDSTPVNQTPIAFRRSKESRTVQVCGDEGDVCYDRGRIILRCSALGTTVTITNPATFGTAIDAFVEETRSKHAPMWQVILFLLLLAVSVALCIKQLIQATMRFVNT